MFLLSALLDYFLLHLIHRFFPRYVENGSLGGVLKTFGTMPEKLVANYTGQILEGLCYLHDKGVVHCDLKVGFKGFPPVIP